MVGIPFETDQFSNIANAVNNGYGILVENTQITEERLSEALQEVLKNPM